MPTAREHGEIPEEGTAGGDIKLEGTELVKQAKERLARIGNHGLARATWSNYRTIVTMLLKCQAETGGQLELPPDMEPVLVYVAWLTQVRKVKHRKIENYLAGIRPLHLVRGLDVPNLRAGMGGPVLVGKGIWRHSATFHSKCNEAQ
jgi:hypothetical protein